MTMVAMVVAMQWPVARAMLRMFRTLITFLKIWPIEANRKFWVKYMKDSMAAATRMVAMHLGIHGNHFLSSYN